MISVAHDGYRNWSGAVPSEPMVRSRQSPSGENKRTHALPESATRILYPLSTKDTDVPGLKEAADTDDAMLTAPAVVRNSGKHPRLSDPGLHSLAHRDELEYSRHVARTQKFSS